MLLGYFMRTKNRASIVREVFREYMESCRENTKITEQRALEVSPDQKPVLLNCFGLQHLLREQLTNRFEHLLTTNALDCALFKSLDNIQRRLDQGWTEAALSRNTTRMTATFREKSRLFNLNGCPTRSPFLFKNL
jgi:hypothetical protein